jgi:hypothetical protein
MKLVCLIYLKQIPILLQEKNQRIRDLKHHYVIKREEKNSALSALHERLRGNCWIACRLTPWFEGNMFSVLNNNQMVFQQLEKSQYLYFDTIYAPEATNDEVFADITSLVDSCFTPCDAYVIGECTHFVWLTNS